ncbi:hypothetical protein OG589_32810 [Sphaerisporangium sp. NBC_01403]|uniref:hypothetical protein n=1 Tax=Sphaerisporangium sp. NBC_01403 TaxID=2903599 RepID=UPI003253F06E
MTSQFDRLDKHEAAVRLRLVALREQAAVLQEQVAGLENRLVHLAITRDTLLSLAEEDAAERTPGQGNEGNARSGSVSGGDPEVTAPPGRRELTGVNEQVMVLMASAGRPMRAKDVALAMGEPNEHRRVETTRTRLKRLVAAGWLAEREPGQFTVAIGVNGNHQKGVASAGV